MNELIILALFVAGGVMLGFVGCSYNILKPSINLACIDLLCSANSSPIMPPLRYYGLAASVKLRLFRRLN